MRKYGTTNHRQVEITVPWNKAPIQIDEGMEELIFCLNFQGFRTMFSCKGTKHTHAYIKFYPEVDLDIAVPYLSKRLKDIPIFWLERDTNVVRWSYSGESAIACVCSKMEKYDNSKGANK